MHPGLSLEMLHRALRDDGIPRSGLDIFTATVAIWRQLDAGIRIRVIASSVSGECYASIMISPLDTAKIVSFCDRRSGKPNQQSVYE